MKKLNLRYSILTGLLIGFLVIFLIPDQLEIETLILLTLPVSKTLEFIEQLSANSYFGNLIAWIIILGFFNAPLLIIRLISKETYERVKMKYFIIISLLIFFSIVYLKGVATNSALEPSFNRFIQIHAISFSFYLLCFGAFYEAFVNNSANYSDYRSVLFVLSFVCLLLAATLAYRIGLTIINFDSTNFWSFSDIGLTVLINFTMFKAINKIFNIFYAENFSLLSEKTLEQLVEVKNIFNKVIEYIIYLTIFVSMLKLFFFPFTSSVNFNFTIPFVELIVSVTLSLFISVISQSLTIKKENEQFV